jgi:hypothetical protein
MKNEIITNMQGVALWQLANNLGHEWAGSRQDRDAIESGGWDAVTTRVTAEMEASHDEYSDARSSLPVGLWPAVAHTTGSGRLSWYCRSFGEGRTLRSVVQLEVNRPAPGLHGGNSVVLRLSAQLTEDGAWILADFESAPEMIELRHIQALALALYDSEDECYVREIVMQIDDAKLHDRLEPEIVAAQERLVSYGLQKGNAE